MHAYFDLRGSVKCFYYLYFINKAVHYENRLFQKTTLFKSIRNTKKTKLIKGPQNIPGLENLPPPPLTNFGIN